MAEPLFTIGHSTRTVDEFLELLDAFGVERVVDVRKLAGSARHPQFNEDVLSASLADAGVDYRRAAALTGRRPVSREVPLDVNGWWQNRSFHNYADHALSDEFRRALGDLRIESRGTRLTIMCSEAVWWRCHRRIIADHLLAHGDDVRHILGVERAEPALLSEGAVIGGDLAVTYPRHGGKQE